jgi:membrane-bound serine protease (ClpP class)
MQISTLYGFLHNPNIAFMLFVIAILGIYLEISHPGAIFPGVVGSIALLLFFLAAGSLSPNWAGLALMVLSFLLLILDLHAPTHGILTIGAILSLVLGAFLFFNSGPDNASHINPFVVYGMAALLGLISFGVIAIVVRVRKLPVTTGVEGMIGAKVVALTPLLPEGWVSYEGERWAAVLDDPTSAVDQGVQVRIVSVEGLRLHVQPLRTRSIVERFFPISQG